jgi:hypothetical protein
MKTKIFKMEIFVRNSDPLVEIMVNDCWIKDLIDVNRYTDELLEMTLGFKDVFNKKVKE